MYKINDKEYDCSVVATLDVFNDKWKLLIIWYLLSGEKRFKELHEHISDISQKTLTVKLKELQEKNIIDREVFAQVPPKVVYSLSSVGEKLKPTFMEMYKWGVSYTDEHGDITHEIVDCDTYFDQLK